MVKNIGRRKFIKSVGVTGASVLAAPYIKTATSAGKLSWNMGSLDTWRKRCIRKYYSFMGRKEWCRY